MKLKNSKFVIRYDIENRVKFHRRGDLNQRQMVLENTINPFLSDYFQYPWETGKRKPFLFDFETLARCSNEIIFFTYIENVEWNKGKYRIMKYPRPACFSEMEIRFVFPEQKEFEGLKVSSQEELLKGIEWTNMKGIIRDLYDHLMKMNENSLDEKYLNNLETPPRRKLNSLETELITKIKQYDKKIQELAKKMAES